MFHWQLSILIVTRHFNMSLFLSIKLTQTLYKSGSDVDAQITTTTHILERWKQLVKIPIINDLVTIFLHGHCMPLAVIKGKPRQSIFSATRGKTTNRRIRNSAVYKGHWILPLDMDNYCTVVQPIRFEYLTWVHDNNPYPMANRAIILENIERSLWTALFLIWLLVVMPFCSV